MTAGEKASDRVTRQVLGALAAGEYSVGEALPAEAQLAERFEVSRLTVRESMSALAAAGVLEVQQGRRSRIAPIERWSVLDADVVAARAKLAGDSSRLVAELMQARRVLEVALARLAAAHISPEQLRELDETLLRMRRELDGDVEQSVSADLRFHQVIAEAAPNAYLQAAFAPLQQMLLTVRRRTSSSRTVREDAIYWHSRVIEALRAGDADAAEAAMTGHMDQTVGATAGISLT